MNPIAEALYDVYNSHGFNIKPSLSSLCKTKAKFGMFIMIKASTESIGNIVGIAPFLAKPENNFVWLNRFGYFLFDNKADLDYTYRPLEEFAEIIYAVTCGPDGVQLDENQ